MGSPSVHVTDLLLLLCAAGLSLGGLTQEQKKQFLDAHNARRQNVHHMPDATGETLEGLGLRVLNMKKMKWDYVLAESAQDMADRCLPDHAFPKVAAYNRTVLQFRTVAMGQNLAMLNTDESVSMVERAVWAWVEREADWYHWHNMSCYNDQPGNNEPTSYCGHLTAALWDSSEYLGCGYSICNRRASSGTYENFVCHYMPGGNIRGVKPFATTQSEAEPMCSDVSYDTDCEYTKLCSNKYCSKAQEICQDDPEYTQTCLGMLGILNSSFTCEADSDSDISAAMKYCPKSCGYCRNEMYKLLPDLVGFEQAKENCAAIDMELVTPKSLQELEDLVTSFYQLAEEFNIPTRRGFWLGYTRLDTGSFGNIYDPSLPIPQDLWRVNQPDDEGNCVVRKRITTDRKMRGADALPCTYGHLALCQLRRSAVEVSTENECQDTLWQHYCTSADVCNEDCIWLSSVVSGNSMEKLCATDFVAYCMDSCGVCDRITQAKEHYHWRIEQEFRVFDYGPFVTSGDGGILPGESNCSCEELSLL